MLIKSIPPGDDEMDVTSTMTEEQFAASFERRRQEAKRFKDERIDLVVQYRFAEDPALSEKLFEAWIMIVKNISDRAVLAETTPKDFEVVHEISVARQCFLINFVDTADIEKSAEMTIERLTCFPEPETKPEDELPEL
jgi:hypothetical protein